MFWSRVTVIHICQSTASLLSLSTKPPSFAANLVCSGCIEVESSIMNKKSTWFFALSTIWVYLRTVLLSGTVVSSPGSRGSVPPVSSPGSCPSSGPPPAPGSVPAPVTEPPEALSNLTGLHADKIPSSTKTGKIRVINVAFIYPPPMSWV
ncbi:hypothetical protein D3C72_1071150 [compost metagenome]